mgnify:CR=1 FL=1
MVGLGHGESQIGRAVFAGILYYHVDDDVRVRNGPENLRRQARLIGNADQGDFGFILVRGYARNQHIVHALLLVNQPSSLGV